MQIFFTASQSPDNPAVNEDQDTQPKDEKKRPPRFLLALPDDVRTALERAAYVGNRTITKEINARLRKSLESDAQAAPRNPGGPYDMAALATVIHTNEKSPASALSDTDRAMLAVFHSLPVQKQLALLSLFQ